jgi:hypothetical protein
MVDPTRLLDLLKSYLTVFGDKPVCYEDLIPYIAIDGDDLLQWTSHLQNFSHSTVRVLSEKYIAMPNLVVLRTRLLISNVRLMFTSCYDTTSRKPSLLLRRRMHGQLRLSRSISRHSHWVHQYRRLNFNLPTISSYLLPKFTSAHSARRMILPSSIVPLPCWSTDY